MLFSHHEINGGKFGVIDIGIVCGKRKYTLFDERDIDFAKQFSLEGFTDVDKNGNGMKVYAIVSKKNDNNADNDHHHLYSDNEIDSIISIREDGTITYFHDLLWVHHFGAIENGCTIRHKNGITVDNRIDNLEMVEIDSLHDDIEEDLDTLASIEVYRAAIRQLSTAVRAHTSTIFLDENGSQVQQEFVDSVYHECHNPCCSNIESFPNEYEACECEVARYCCDTCQLEDNKHQDECFANRIENENEDIAHVVALIGH